MLFFFHVCVVFLESSSMDLFAKYILRAYKITSKQKHKNIMTSQCVV